MVIVNRDVLSKWPIPGQFIIPLAATPRVLSAFSYEQSEESIANYLELGFFGLQRDCSDIFDISIFTDFLPSTFKLLKIFNNFNNLVFPP